MTYIEQLTDTDLTLLIVFIFLLTSGFIITLVNSLNWIHIVFFELNEPSIFSIEKINSDINVKDIVLVKQKDFNDTNGCDPEFMASLDRGNHLNDKFMKL